MPLNLGQFHDFAANRTVLTPPFSNLSIAIRRPGRPTDTAATDSRCNRALVGSFPWLLGSIAGAVLALPVARWSGLAIESGNGHQDPPPCFARRPLALMRNASLGNGSRCLRLCLFRTQWHSHYWRRAPEAPALSWSQTG